jgi:hypothetical protein
MAVCEFDGEVDIFETDKYFLNEVYYCCNTLPAKKIHKSIMVSFVYHNSSHTLPTQATDFARILNNIFDCPLKPTIN